ncbi:MAG: glucuronate isomerase [Treponema sp.]|jgi:glucuronate isomerase|nr:glucuronate isomerase [Treponema sp.]
MKFFLDENFLLETETARELYRAAAANPIFDYHCHLPPGQIAENRRFNTLTEAWLEGDHYKWRALRAMGFDESLITGGADPYEKFLAWARTVEELIGNPLYHWTHLELRRFFGIETPLSGKTAREIWERANALLPRLTVKDIFEKFNVYAVGTTDDPADSLEYHRAVAEGSAPIGKIAALILPTFRPDRALDIEAEGFAGYIEKLGAAAGTTIQKVDDVRAALERRLDYFIARGCRAGDHSFAVPPFVLRGDAEIDRAFGAALSGVRPDPVMAEAYKTKVLSFLAGMYARRGVVMQLHFGALRNLNTRMYKLLGPDAGFDAPGDGKVARALASLLDHIDGSGSPERSALPKTILYCLNPADYYPLVTIMGAFQHNDAGRGGRGIKGKMQLGSAWWFCDHKNGMEKQIRILSETGLLSVFVGMLTDSRCFLSYPRHEYFRRVLCGIIGGWVENGEYPADMETLFRVVNGVCFENARLYFG